MLKKLRARLAALKGEAQTILNTADTEAGGVMTAEQSERITAILREVGDVQASIDAAIALEAIEEDDAAPRRTTTAANPAVATVRDNRNDDPTRGFANVAEFGVVVRAASVPGESAVDPRLKLLGAPTNFHRESGSAENEGFMVPPAFSQKVTEIAFSDDDLLGQVDSEPTSGNAVQMDRDETTPWGATGVKAHWAAEGAQFQPSKIEAAQESLKLHKLYAFVLATDELLSDAPRLNARLTTKSGEAIRWAANVAIGDGNGVGKLLGYRKAASYIAVAKDSGQAAKTITLDNVTNMYIRNLNPGRAYWRANVDVLPQLMKLAVGSQPAFILPGGIKDAPGGMLLGRPIRWTEHCETLGTLNDIEFIDPLGYYMALRGGVEFAASMHLYFDYGLQAFRWTFRLGGQPFLKNAVSPNKGTATKSHFVGLATRA